LFVILAVGGVIFFNQKPEAKQESTTTTNPVKEFTVTAKQWADSR
jgi:hypothetical protein